MTKTRPKKPRQNCRVICWALPCVVDDIPDQDSLWLAFGVLIDRDVGVHFLAIHQIGRLDGRNEFRLDPLSGEWRVRRKLDGPSAFAPVDVARHYADADSVEIVARRFFLE